MATGYTHDVLEGKLTLRQFILRVAHGMGPLISLRDCDTDCPIPDEIKPSGYYAERLEQAKAKHAQLLTMTPEEQIEHGKRQIRSSIESHKEGLEAKKRNSIHVKSMIEKVQAWEPPTKDHEPLKKYMLDQLQSTWNFDCDLDYWEEELAKLETAEPIKWYEGSLKSAARDVTYYTEHLEEELRGCEFATKWIQALKKSVDALPTD